MTRQNIFVDRIASAWLIRRFIDPKARFRFVASDDSPAKKGELRFDMFEAEYTHEGDRCTFETLVRRFKLDDPALRAMAEVVHDIDCKDQKFSRLEATGVERLLEGLAKRHTGDAARLAHGGEVFEHLYESLQEPGPAPGRGGARVKRPRPTSRRK